MSRGILLLCLLTVERNMCLFCPLCACVLAVTAESSHLITELCAMAKPRVVSASLQLPGGPRTIRRGLPAMKLVMSV